MKPVTDGVLAPKGYQAAGVFCDIKRLGTGKGSDKGSKRDLAVLRSSVPAAVAGLFTTNQVCAAPIKVCVPRVAKGKAQAVVINSGNANACTGRQGMSDAREMARLTEKELGIPAGLALVASTGRIGVGLPMDQVRNGIQNACGNLGDTSEHAAHCAEAILTSDSRSKTTAYEWGQPGARVRLGGMAKGAGMIQPGMSATGKRPAATPQGLHATMLAFLTTDASVAPKVLQTALEEAVALSFNRITVDGDMSTNDTVLLLANGLSGAPHLDSLRHPDFPQFLECLKQVCLDLALQIVRDGEGVHRVVTVRVEGARSASDADDAARAVANSALVKTSWHGGDPNWGRIIDALGYSPAKVVEQRVDIGYRAPGSKKTVWSLKQGQPTTVPFETLCQAVQPDEFELVIQLNLGRGNATIYAADLTEAYVDYNKGNVADPSTLGG
jgi:glutamate N-acetyltransferase/amino-acid N-acetyltransferase